jgi:hypothetical protein
MIAHPERYAIRQWLGLLDQVVIDSDRARTTHRHEMPDQPAAFEVALLLGDLGLGQSNLAVRRTADPDREAWKHDDPYRIGVSSLDVQACIFRHRGIDSSMRRTCRATYPRSTKRSVPPASQRFQVPPHALAATATA